MEKSQEQLVDEGLVAASQAGDSSALSKLYDRHSVSLYRFIYRHVNHPQDAEDITSDCMLRMVNGLTTFRKNATFKSWLYGIARNAIADHWRTRYKLREELISEFSGIGAVALAADEAADDDAEDPREAMASQVFAQLPDQYRIVLQHRFIEQHTVADTAAAMNITEGNVKVIQYRALKKAAQIAKEMV